MLLPDTDLCEKRSSGHTVKFDRHSFQC